MLAFDISSTFAQPRVIRATGFDNAVRIYVQTAGFQRGDLHDKESAMKLVEVIGNEARLYIYSRKEGRFIHVKTD